MPFNLFKKDFQQTDYKAGFLKIPELRFRLGVSASESLVLPDGFVSPRKIDNRDLCLQSSNQGNTPQCAAYSAAGFIEVLDWKIKGHPKQIDPYPLYKEAKTIDGDPSGEGTTLEAITQAALRLKLIDGQVKLFRNDFNLIKYTIHRYGSCILGFMITNEWNYTSTKTGRISDFGIKSVKLGGHAIYGCGFDQEGLYIQNSWGPDWGLYGFALIPWKQVAQQFVYGAVIVPTYM
jgi:hypothetical protein